MKTRSEEIIEELAEVLKKHDCALVGMLIREASEEAGYLATTFTFQNGFSQEELYARAVESFTECAAELTAAELKN